MHTVPSSEPARKKSFCALLDLVYEGSDMKTHGRCHCCIVLLTVVQVCGLAIRSRLVHSYHTVGTSCDQVFAIRSVCEESGARGICRCQHIADQRFGYCLRAGLGRTQCWVTVVIVYCCAVKSCLRSITLAADATLDFTSRHSHVIYLGITSLSIINS